MDLLGRVNQVLTPAAERAFRTLGNLRVQTAKRDSRVKYPSYKSLDAFIDVERLRSVDEELREGIMRRARTQDVLFHTGILTLQPSAPKRPGSQIIFLSRSVRPFSYFDLDKPDLWTPSDDAAEFPELMAFIGTLPFKSTARMMIMYDRKGGMVTPHRDHPNVEVCHEFIWFRTNLSKPFYVQNPRSREKQYVQSYSAWFDTVNQFHGADGRDEMTLSIRVDGVFSDEFRKQIPTPQCNAASTPSFWAGIE